MWVNNNGKPLKPDTFWSSLDSPKHTRKASKLEDEGMRYPHNDVIFSFCSIYGYYEAQCKELYGVSGVHDAVFNTMADYLRKLYKEYYMVPEDKRPAVLANFVPRFILDREYLAPYESEKYAYLFLNAVNLMVEVQCFQKDKSGLPYYFHPIRVASNCTLPDSTIAAILHDVLEDTYLTSDDLKKLGFSDNVVEIVESVTRREGETYAKFIERASQTKESTEVKIADLTDNLDVSRLNELTDQDVHRLRKYIHSLRYLYGVEKNTRAIID